MTRFLAPLLLGVLVLTDTSPPSTLVERAIEATGGREKLAAMKAYKRTARGTFHGTTPAPVTVEWIFQPPDRLRQTSRMEVQGTTFVLTRVLAGGKGWIRDGEHVRPLEAVELAEFREELNAVWLSGLLPLLDSGVTLSRLEGGSGAGAPGIGLRATRVGYRPVTLYFDSEKGLLSRYEVRMRVGGGREVTQEVSLGDYHDEGGARRPRRVAVKRDGRLILDLETTEFQTLEVPDGKLFEQP